MSLRLQKEKIAQQSKETIKAQMEAFNYWKQKLELAKPNLSASVRGSIESKEEAEEDGGCAAYPDHDMVVNIAPQSYIVPTVLFLKGHFEMITGDLEAALATGEKCAAEFPQRCEGYYLKALAYEALKQPSNAVSMAQAGRVTYSETGEEFPLEGELLETVNQLFVRLAIKVKGSKQDEFRQAMKAHGDKFDAYTGGICKKCHNQFFTPTPQWMCVHCWPTKEELVWEPDSVTLCCCCNGSVGKFTRHHCRCCGHVVCSKCSKNKSSVGLLNYLDPVKVCDKCMRILDSHQSQRHL